ncbi:nucleoside monophosphate kinase [Patescibacteria group bacterium]|nr:nucleoside monophosphate kinase [Patescibacteria group bacterium]MBU4481670.1 nucleoside monophosphate kinase [Patescibacteria group bacterium]
MNFPIFKTKIEGLTRKFNLTDPKDQRDYFEAKAGREIEKLREYLKNNTFVAYLLGKKNSGKGTYSKMFAEIVAPEKVKHFSMGDMIRNVDRELADEKKKKELFDFLKKNYRGRFPLKEIISGLERRDTKTLLPTELILTLVKREMEKKEKKAIFIDGFPRDLDQIGFSLFFRDLIGHRDDPDVFILIDVPEKVIDERIKWRRVCPACQTSRNLKLLPTSKIGYDKEKNDYYLLCDNPNCSALQSFAEQNLGGRGVKLLPKEGDELGIEPIRERFIRDEKLMEMAFSLYGIPKILLRNSLPVKEAKNFVDDYEITPEYVFELDEKENKVKIKERPWVFSVQGVESLSLLPQPVVVSLIKQMVNTLNL